MLFQRKIGIKDEAEVADVSRKLNIGIAAKRDFQDCSLNIAFKVVGFNDTFIARRSFRRFSLMSLPKWFDSVNSVTTAQNCREKKKKWKKRDSEREREREVETGRRTFVPLISSESRSGRNWP